MCGCDKDIHNQENWSNCLLMREFFFSYSVFFLKNYINLVTWIDLYGCIIVYSVIFMFSSIDIAGLERISKKSD